MKLLSELTREEAIEIIAYRNAYQRGRSDGEADLRATMIAMFEAFSGTKR